MNTNEKSAKPTVIPVLRYRDAQAAINWLCKSCGFERKLIVPDADGGIRHAQLTCGNGMVMLGSAKSNDSNKVAKTSATTGELDAQSIHIIIADVDQHYTKAVEAGAEIVMAIQDEDYGGRAYSCRDPEGYVWSFGSYDPWSHSKV